MSFEKLLSDIQALGSEQETMSKALPADDGKDDANIQTAAEEGGDMEEGDEGSGGGDGGAQGTTDEDEDQEEPLGKSLGTVTLANGEKVEAVDGTEMMKSLVAQVADIKLKSSAQELSLAKALEGAVGLIKSQTTMLKSLQSQVSKIAGQGRGRKTVLTVAEKTSVGAEKTEDSMTGADFMAKSHEAWKAGRISGKDLTIIDVSLRQNAPIEPALIAKVVTPAK